MGIPGFISDFRPVLLIGWLIHGREDSGICFRISSSITDWLVGTFSRNGFQAKSKDQEILEEGGGAGPSHLPRRDHE